MWRLLKPGYVDDGRPGIFLFHPQARLVLKPHTNQPTRIQGTGLDNPSQLRWGVEVRPPLVCCWDSEGQLRQGLWPRTYQQVWTIGGPISARRGSKRLSPRLLTNAVTTVKGVGER